MFRVPKEKKVRVPLAVGLVVVSLGFFFFESLGAFVGHFADDIKQWEAEEIKAHPEAVSVQADGYPIYSNDEAASTGLSRIQFFHGHGYLMVLASLIFIMLITFAPGMKPLLKSILMWIALVSMLMYNIGWGLAGLLVPYLGVDGALHFSEYALFMPFGLSIVVVTGIIAFDYGIQAVRVIRQIESGP
jgi:hypothetical protein